MKFFNVNLAYFLAGAALTACIFAASGCGEDVGAVTVKEEISSHRMPDGTTCFVIKYAGSVGMSCK